MANLPIPHDDLIATLEAQRNEAWNAAANAGAAARAAGKRIDELEQDLAAAKTKLTAFPSMTTDQTIVQASEAKQASAA